MINFDVHNAWTGAVQFTAEIDCAEDAPRGWKLRLAVEWVEAWGAASGVDVGAVVAGGGDA